MEPLVNRNAAANSGRVVCGIVLALLLALSALSALTPADAASKAAPKKALGFDPLVASPDVLAFKTAARNVRVAASADAIRASLKGFPEVTFNDRGYTDRLLIRSPGPSGSIEANLDLGCNCGCGGVPKEYAKAGIVGLEYDETASMKERASWRIRWDFAGKSDRILSGAISADNKGEKLNLPVDIIRLDRGTRVAFAVYDPKKGFAGSKQLGETISLSGRIVVPELSPAPKTGDFLLAVANFGTNVVRLRGGSDGLRPITGNPAAPLLQTDDTSAIGPGEMAILNLTHVSNTGMGVIIHFEGADMKVTWGLPGIAMSPAGLIGIGTFFVGGSVFAVARKRNGAKKA